LKAVADQSRRVLMVDFNERYLDRNRVLKEVIAGNRAGRIASAAAFHNQDLRRHGSLASLQRAVTGGGVVHNAGIHFINLFRHWFGAVDCVQAVFENRALPPGCGEDTAHCRFRFRNGVSATLEASFANVVDTTYERVRLCGAQGEITSDLKKGDIFWRRPDRRPLRIPCRPETISDSVFNALAEFARCVRTGAAPETGVDDFLETMKVVEALTLSAQRGAEVLLDEIERKYAR
jgi:predicted dehydrogenase